MALSEISETVKLTVRYLMHLRHVDINEISKTHGLHKPLRLLGDTRGSILLVFFWMVFSVFQ